MGEAVLPFVVLAVMLIGLFGLLTTIIPGLAIIWVAALVYFIVTGFSTGSIILFVVMTILTVVGSLLDNVIMGAKARQSGASWLAIGVALLAGLVGTLAFPPFGGLVAALLGLFVMEYLRLRDPKLAFDSAKNMAAGCGWAVLLRFGIGMIMILMWGLYVLSA
ncbi:MAG TPA: DUF456 domain-containing protein [Anaerolineaceae bacterium]